jgi:hypothetical protein
MSFTAEQDLKIRILANGISVDETAEKAWHGKYEGPLTLNEYASTAGICARIEDGGDGVWVNAPFTQEFTQGSDIELRAHQDGRFILSHSGQEFDTTVIPVPLFHQETYTNESGLVLPLTNLGVTHTDRIRISPIEGCGMVCMFCNIPFELTYKKKPLEEMLRVIDLAKDDPQAPARHVLISGGTPNRKHEDWEDEIYEAIIDGSPLPVDIMMTPREKGRAYVRRLGEVGINALSINIEVIDDQRAKKLIPTKRARFGNQGYLDYIEGAVGELGIGRVQSLILFGEAIEPLNSTLKGVQDLVDRGCVPVLSPFRPDARTPMENDPPSSDAEMREVYERTLEICDNSNIGIMPGPRCVPCHHNTLAFSDGKKNSFYISEDDEITRRFEPGA